MNIDIQNARCLVCEKTSGEAPLIPLAYRGATVWICPQDLPILIHQPSRLADRLPGAGELTPASHRD